MTVPITAHPPPVTPAARQDVPEQRKRNARPLLAAAAALAIAGAATVAITANSGQEAWAVTKNADGSVTVTIRDIKGVDAASAKLREYGIGAKAVPMSRDCAELDESRMDLLGGYVLPRIADDGSVTMSSRRHPCRVHSAAGRLHPAEPRHRARLHRPDPEPRAGLPGAGR